MTETPSETHRRSAGGCLLAIAFMVTDAATVIAIGWGVMALLNGAMEFAPTWQKVAVVLIALIPTVLVVRAIDRFSRRTIGYGPFDWLGTFSHLPS